VENSSLFKFRYNCQYFVLNSVSQNNNDFFKFLYDIVSLIAIVCLLRDIMGNEKKCSFWDIMRPYFDCPLLFNCCVDDDIAGLE
jgi:hypothetical protein